MPMRVFALIGALSILCTAGGDMGAADESDDPYVWLEDVWGQRSLDWVNAENARTLAILKADPRYPEFYAEELKVAQAEDRIPTPSIIGDRITNFWRDSAHPHGLWRVTSKADYRNAAPAWSTLVDVDALSAEEKVNWVWLDEEWNWNLHCEPVAERACLLPLSDGGEDAITLREFDLAGGKFAVGGFLLPHSKQQYAWTDENTLLVSRDWGEGTLTESGYPFVVRELKRGQPLSEAREIFRGAASDEVGTSPQVFVDGQGRKAAILARFRTYFVSDKYLVTDAGVEQLPLPGKSDVVGLVDGRLIVRIDEDWTPAGMSEIPAGSIVAIDLGEWKSSKAMTPQVVFSPGPREAVEDVSVTRSAVIAAIYDNVRGRAYIFTPSGSGWTSRRLPLPDNAAIDLLATNSRSDDAFLSVTSFLDPDALWAIDAASATAEPIKALAAKFDSSQLVVEQFEATSKDGTHIPYFVVHRRDLTFDGSTPTILSAYGGFQISSTPYYPADKGTLWLERGGAFAIANIRGGGEFGPAWHEAGLKTKRQCVYDDFAAVGQDLIRRRITSPRRLGIAGGSNGGLLMGVEMIIQHPGLWHAVTIAVPLLDMLRYEQIAAGASWVGEYGSVGVPEEKAFLASISPYANLKPGVSYPEPFIWTTTKDDRVGPAHARKFAARMMEYGLPYLYYEDTAGGHSGDADLAQVATTNALVMIYFTRKLMDETEPP